MLELQHKIEEKRLILGKKLENFLLKKISNFADFLNRLLSFKSLPAFTLSSIFLLSIFIRSTRDIGYNSGYLLHLIAENSGQGIAYQITKLPVWLAKFFDVSPIIIADFFVNLLGILSIYTSFIILKKSAISQNIKLLNLLITSFAAAFFLRVFTLQFNDFVTGYSYFLAAFLPFYAYLFAKFSTKITSTIIAIATGFFALILFFSKNHFYAAESVIYSLLLPIITVIFYDLISRKYINWRRDFVVLIFILVVLQFDWQIFEKVIFNFGTFWWCFVLFLAPKFPQKNKIHNFFFWLGFIALVALTIFLTINKNTQEIAWLFSTAILIFTLVFYQKMHEKYCTKELSRTSAAALFVVLSYFINLHLAAIFNFGYFSNFKSPNYFTDQITGIYKFQKTLIISNQRSDGFPLSNYVSQIEFISEEERLEKINQKIFDQKFAFLAINQSKYSDNFCEISFLEKAFRDQNFKENFLQNYVFFTRILESESAKKDVKFFAQDELQKGLLQGSRITKDYEIYVRKN